MGHLGVWAGMYALAAFVCLSQLVGTALWFGLPRWDAMLCVLITGIAVYGLDRVKLAGEWIDPADIAAQPERYEFLRRTQRTVRFTAAVLLVAAGCIGARVSWLVPLLVLFGAVGTVAYAPWPRRGAARLKDRLWLKNAYVAGGMSLFSLLMAVLSADGERWRMGLLENPAVFAVGAAVVGLRVFLDAALCDIDDEATDRAYRTRTFATAVGSGSVWNWAGLGRMGLAAGLPFLSVLPPLARIAWSAAMLLGMAALRWRRPVLIRDTVDVRFLPEALFVAAVLAAVRTQSS